MYTVPLPHIGKNIQLQPHTHTRLHTCTHTVNKYRVQWHTHTRTSLALNASFLFSAAPHKWWHARDQESQNSHTHSHTDIQSAQEGTGAGGEPGLCSSSGWVFITCRSRGLSPLKAMKMLHLCEREEKKLRLKESTSNCKRPPTNTKNPNSCTDSCTYRFTHFILLHFIRAHPFSWDYGIIIWHALTHTHRKTQARDMKPQMI